MFSGIFCGPAGAKSQGCPGLKKFLHYQICFSDICSILFSTLSFLELCPPIIPSIGILLRPNSCSYQYSVVGTRCSATCLSNEGSLDIICMSGGIWSAVPSECDNSEESDDFFGSNEDLSETFMIRQFYPDNIHICLQVTKQ